MAILADMHMHSSFSGDSKAPMEEMVKAAIQKGLSQICFTEHFDKDYFDENGVPTDMFHLNADSYLYDLLMMREQYAGQIRILFGVEVGVQPHLKKDLTIFVNEHDYDFVLSSTHVVDGKDPYYPAFMNAFPEEVRMKVYLEEVRKNLDAFKIFDSLAHLDYACRYFPQGAAYSLKEVEGTVEEILSFLIKHEKALEVNSGAFRHGLPTTNPRREILSMYREMGGELITIGSDAHKPVDIAYGYEQTAALLKELGFKCYYVYERRTPEAFSI